MLIDDESKQREVISTERALALAQERQLDLVLVAPTATPPVARILEYGKYRYEQDRIERQRRKQSKPQEIKEIRLSALMEEHDLEQRLERAKKWLAEGNRVKLSLRFAGRQMIFKDKGLGVLKNFADRLEMRFETEPRFMGKVVNVLLAPKKNETQDQPDNR